MKIENPIARTASKMCNPVQVAPKVVRPFLFPEPVKDKKRRRKFILGENACDYCQRVGHHDKCRPRYDWTLCSCSCNMAQNTREAYEGVCATAQAEGRPVPTVEEAFEQEGEFMRRRKDRRDPQKEVFVKLYLKKFRKALVDSEKCKSN